MDLTRSMSEVRVAGLHSPGSYWKIMAEMYFSTGEHRIVAPARSTSIAVHQEGTCVSASRRRVFLNPQKRSSNLQESPLCNDQVVA
jgi:hypothetical protein